MSEVQIKSERLLLRRMTRDDVPALHGALSDPEVMRYWSTLPHDDLALTEAWVDATIEAVAAGAADDYAVLLDGVVIGKAGLWDGREIGVMLSRATWGHGYATEALSAVIEHAFAHSGTEIVADIDPRNTASLRLFERLGFRQTGSAKATFQIGEVWTDSVYVALTPEEWASRPRRLHSGEPTRGRPT